MIRLPIDRTPKGFAAIWCSWVVSSQGGEAVKIFDCNGKGKTPISIERSRMLYQISKGDYLIKTIQHRSVYVVKVYQVKEIDIVDAVLEQVDSNLKDAIAEVKTMTNCENRKAMNRLMV